VSELELPGEEDLDQSGMWVIPGARTKNGVTHRVPLTSRIVGLLREARTTGPKIREGRDIRPNDNAFCFAGDNGASVAARAKKAMAALRRAGAIGFDVHRHDLRRTSATNLAAAGVSRIVIGHLLNHTDDGPRATRIYDRFEHDVEKRVALEAWDRRIAAILTATEPAAVLPFARG
jgi:integrase